MPDKPITTLTANQILDLPMPENDAGAATIRGYFAEIALRVWVEEDGFSGKRPFGNSSWWTEIHAALADAGVVDEEAKFGDVTEIVENAIRSMGTPVLVDEARGEACYAGYFTACGGKSLVSGAELPSWDEQAPEIRAAWVAAAAAVR